MNNNFIEVSENDLCEINGGLSIEVISLIGIAVTIIIGIAKTDLENASERGKNDAYNDMKRNNPIYTPNKNVLAF